MSYQSFLRSTSGSNLNKTPSPSPVPRKPAASSTSGGPAPVKIPSIYTSVTSSATNITPASTNNAPFTPASSNHSSALRSNPTSASPVAPQPTSTTTSDRQVLTKEEIDTALRTCLALQSTATSLHGKRPFGALLLAPDNSTVLLTHFSISHVQHAETELARLASIHFSQKYLASCTLVSTWEPCAMCAGTIYWTNIGRVLYAASETKLKELTGANNEENMTLSMPCREVLKAGQKVVEVVGPVAEWEEKVVHESGKWWKEHQAVTESRQREGSVNGSTKPGSVSSMSLRQGTPTTWTGEESVLSSINDEGEYSAELDIDWMR